MAPELHPAPAGASRPRIRPYGPPLMDGSRLFVCEVPAKEAKPPGELFACGYGTSPIHAWNAWTISWRSYHKEPGHA
jgi:hypothetical protein